jgi:divalent metal cation (Fe/Co/Zn/Cd) transporter
MQLGPEQVLLTAHMRFDRELDVERLEDVIGQVENRIQSEEPDIEQVFLQPRALDRRDRRSKCR